MSDCGSVGPRGLIIEGVPGTGKTSTFLHLKKRIACKNGVRPTKLFVSEQLTQRVLEPIHNKGLLAPEDNINHLEKFLNPLKQYRDMLANRGWSTCEENQFTYVLERFHLTHCVYYNNVSWQNVEVVDKELSGLFARLVILTVDEEDLIERIFSDRGQGWLGYVSRYGKSREEIVEHYMRCQDQYLKLAKRTGLPVRTISSSQFKVSEVVDFVFEHIDLG